MSKFECNTMQEVYENKFRKLYTDKALAKLSPEEKIQYYEDLKCYLRTLDYDKDQIELDEQHFLKAGKVIIPVYDFLFRPKGINMEKEKNREKSDVGTIYVCNHTGSLDQFSIISALGKDRPLHILASDTLLNLKRGILYKYAGCVFIDLKNIKNMFQGLEQVEKILLDGRDVLIFPEGTRNATEEFILPFLPGAIIASRNTGARIVPLAINENMKLFGDTLYVRCGEEFMDDLNDDSMVATEKLQREVMQLMWENYFDEAESGAKPLTRDEVIEQQEKKRLSLEKQRAKINKR